MTERDPRVYFAAERTLLAWVRTGVAVIGLGFVVARLHPDPARAGLVRVLGGGMSLAGGAVTALAMLEFKLFLRRLLPEQWPEPRFGAQLGMLLALVMAGVGILLGIYLLGVA